MRSIGYSFPSAIADLLDNSVSVHAKHIDILTNPSSDPFNHKINLKLLALTLAVFIAIVIFHNTHVHIELANQKLVVDDILHDVRFFRLSLRRNAAYTQSNNARR